MDGWVTLVIAAVIGRLCWSPLEYAIHGLLSHRFRTFVTPLHWSHHRTPAAVFTSPLAWVPTAAVAFAVAAALAGVAVGGAFSLGLLSGFLHYEYVHWRIHFRRPTSRRQRRLRDHHLAHHFVDPRAYHGVTSHAWDRVFGTLPASREADYARGAAFPPLGGRNAPDTSPHPRHGTAPRSGVDTRVS